MKLKSFISIPFAEVEEKRDGFNFVTHTPGDNTTWGKLPSGSEQAPLQQGLHVPASVDDQENIDVLFDNTVNDAIRFEKPESVSPSPALRVSPF